jgi:hypothetical protein
MQSSLFIFEKSVFLPASDIILLAEGTKISFLIVLLRFFYFSPLLRLATSKSLSSDTLDLIEGRAPF